MPRPPTSGDQVTTDACGLTPGEACVFLTQQALASTWARLLLAVCGLLVAQARPPAPQSITQRFLMGPYIQ